MKTTTLIAIATGSTVCLGILLSYVWSSKIDQANQEKIESTVHVVADKLADQVLDRFTFYEYGLLGARGAIVTVGKANLSRERFLRYARSQDFDSEYPGALGFGFIRRVKKQDEEAFVQAARRDGWPDFSVRQLSPHEDERYIIQYIEPVHRNLAAVGLDIASETNRRTAADKARDTGEAHLTGPITLVQATGEVNQSFLILLPIYSTVSMPEQLKERREQLVGWSYAPLIIHQILSDLDLDKATTKLTLKDVTESADGELFYQSDDHDKVYLENYTIHDQRKIMGRIWHFEFKINTHFVKQIHLPSPLFSFTVGIIITSLLAAIVGILVFQWDKRRKIFVTKSRLSAIVDSSVDAIISKNLQGQVMSWNSGAEKLFGFSADEAIGKTIAELIVPAEIQHEEIAILEAIRQGKVVNHFTTVRKRRDGSKINVSVAVSPIVNEKGVVIGASKTARDITEQVESKQKILELNMNLAQQVNERTRQLETAKRNLEIILNAMPSMIGYWDIHLTNLVANKAFHEWYKLPEGSIPGMSMQALLGVEKYSELRPYIKSTLSGKSQTFEQTLKKDTDSKLYHMLTHFIPDKNNANDAVVGFFVITHDVSELTESRLQLIAAKEEADAANRAKSAFLANMSHEIRTPMNGVIGMLHLIGREPLSEQQQRYLTMAENSAAALTNLINDILDFSKIEAGKLAIERRLFNLFTLIEETCASLALAAQSKDLEFVLDLADVDHCMMVSDDYRIRQIIINLISNAIKFTQKGSVTVYAKTQLLDKKSIALTCSVRDTGTGIVKEKQNTMFQYFSQADSSITRKYGGTGLGLTISKRLCQLLGGDITLNSEVGVGSTFTFTVLAGATEQVDNDVSSLPSKKMRFIIADPEHGTRHALERIISKFSKTIISDKALAPDWYKAPEFDGETILFYSRHAVPMEEKFESVRGNETIRIIELIKDHQMPSNDTDLYLIKPFTPRTVFQLVAKVLDSHDNPTRALSDEIKNDRSADRELEVLLKQHAGKRVLLVDDNDINLEVAKGILDGYALKVDCAHNGLEAIEYLTRASAGKNHYSLVLMDCQMPVLDGLQTSKQIRDGVAGESSIEIPIVAMTANAMAGSQDSCLASGMNDFLSKPIDPIELAEKLLFWLNLSEESRKNINIHANHAKTETDSKPADSEPVWDQSGALARVRNKPDRLKALVDLFFRDMPNRMDQLSELYCQGDYNELSKLAHAIKGVAGNLGGQQLYHAASALEIAAGNSNQDAVQVLLKDIQSKYQELWGVFVSFVNNDGV